MVRVGTPSAVARPDWYDRNPIPTNLYWDAETGPHAATERWTYTVPSGKKALVEVLQCVVKRTVAATTPLTPYTRISYTPSGGTERSLLTAILLSAENAVKDKMESGIGATLTMFVGDRIRAMSADAGTGGTCFYLAAGKVTEFDA